MAGAPSLPLFVCSREPVEGERERVRTLATVALKLVDRAINNTGIFEVVFNQASRLLAELQGHQNDRNAGGVNQAQSPSRGAKKETDIELDEVYNGGDEAAVMNGGAVALDGSGGAKSGVPSGGTNNGDGIDWEALEKEGDEALVMSTQEQIRTDQLFAQNLQDLYNGSELDKQFLDVASKVPIDYTSAPGTLEE